MAAHALGDVGRAEVPLMGIFRGHHHADGDRLAMDQPVRIAGGGLERVPESVAEIEQRPLARLAFIGGDDGGLGGAADGDRPLACGAAGEHLRPAVLKPGEELGIVDEAVFGDFGVASAEVAFG